MRRSPHLIIAAAFVAALPAHAQPTDASALSGRWSGTYHCNQGVTALELTLRGNVHGIVHGTFAFSPTPENPEVLTGSYPVLADASAPYAWAEVADGSLEHFAWAQACADLLQTEQ